MGFQQTRNTIACLPFDHAQRFESTTDHHRFALLKLRSNRTPLLPVVACTTTTNNNDKNNNKVFCCCCCSYQRSSSIHAKQNRATEHCQHVYNVFFFLVYGMEISLVQPQAAQALSMNHTSDTTWHRIIKVSI